MNSTDEKTLFRLNNSELFINECEGVGQRCIDAEVTVRRDREKGVIYLKNYGIKERLLYKEPFRIIKLFNLTSEWATSVREHIITGEPLKAPSPQLLMQWNSEMGSWELYTSLHRKTSQVEVENALKTYSDFRKLLKEDVSITMDKEDIFMLNEYKNGASIKEIQAKLKNDHNKILDEEYIRRRLSIIRKQLGEEVRVKKITKK